MKVKEKKNNNKQENKKNNKQNFHKKPFNVLKTVAIICGSVIFRNNKF